MPGSAALVVPLMLTGVIAPVNTAEPPSDTPMPLASNPLPSITMLVPPTDGPSAGVMAVATGPRYVKPFGISSNSPVARISTRRSADAVSAGSARSAARGTTAVITSPATSETVASWPPMVTSTSPAVSPARLLTVISTSLPPMA